MGKLVAAVLVVVLLVVFSPLATIWALNTLFHLSIPYKFSTWAAAVVLNVLVGGGGAYKRS